MGFYFSINYIMRKNSIVLDSNENNKNNEDNEDSEDSEDSENIKVNTNNNLKIEINDNGTLFDDVKIKQPGRAIRKLSTFYNNKNNISSINNNILDKNNLINHVQNKIEKLDLRMRYANGKFEDIRFSFKKYSISIIYLATILTLIEAFTNSINLQIINNAFIIRIIQFMPLILSSLISLLAAVIKFNRFEEKIENITRATEKCIATMAKLKGVKEDLHFCQEDTKFIKVRERYKNDVYREYLDSNTCIEKQLLETDYNKYTNRIYRNEIAEKELELIKNRKIKLLENKYKQPIHDISLSTFDIFDFDSKILAKKIFNKTRRILFCF